VTVLPPPTETTLEASFRSAAMLVPAKPLAKSLSIPTRLAASAPVVNPKNIFSHGSTSLLVKIYLTIYLYVKVEDPETM
jgi:hypothetical protein